MNDFKNQYKLLILFSFLYYSCSPSQDTVTTELMFDQGISGRIDMMVNGGDQGDESGRMMGGGMGGEMGGDIGGHMDGGHHGGRQADPPEGGTSTPILSTEEQIAQLSVKGPHYVGYFTENITYQVPVRGDMRTLKLAWWYPTANNHGSAVPYGGSSPTRFAQQNVDVLADLHQAPVLIFSHGNGGIAEQSFFLTEYFASHGWIVLAVEHTGNTLSNMTEEMYWLFELRPYDISAALDHLAELPSEHLLAQKVSTSHWALSGHSFGGYTTLAIGGAGYAIDDIIQICEDPPANQQEACDYTQASQERYRIGFADPRLKAFIPMTPAGAELFGGTRGLNEISAPVMMMTAGLDATLPNVREGDPLWRRLTQAESVRIDFLYAGHFTFSNACELAPLFLENDGCGDRFIPYLQAHQLINLYALAFAKRYVLGEVAMMPIIRGEHLPNGAAEELTVSVKE